MRKVLYLLILLVTFSTVANAQYIFVTHTTGTVNYGGINVTVTPIGSPSTTTPVCNLAPYYIGNAGASGYRYQFNPPITHVRARFYELQSSDSIEFSLAGTPINLTAANLSNYTGPCGAATTGFITTNGQLSSTSTPTSGVQAGAQIDYQNSPSTISDIRIYQTKLNSNGVVMDFQFKRDSCDLDFEAWADTPTCRFRDLQLNAYTFPNTTYSWTGPNGWTSNQQNPVRTPAQLTMNGTYTVTATRGGCVYTKSFTVNIDNIPNKPTVAQDGPVCPGYNDTLRMNTNIPGGGTFEWRGPNGQTASTIDNFLPLNSITPAAAGQWYMFALTTNGCSSDTTYFTADINSPVVAAFDVDSTFGCGSDTVNITNNTVGNTDPNMTNTNNWTFGDGNSSTQRNPTHVYTAQGTFTITLIASNGECSDTADHVVQLVHPITADFTVDDDSICQGTEITLTNASVVTPGTVPVYTWDYSNGDTGKTFDDVYTYIKPGTYTVSLFLEDYLGCKDTARRTIVVDSIGSVDFTASSTNICVGDAIDFSGTYSPQGNTGFTWTFDDGVILPSVLDVRHIFEKPKTSYNVTLDATYRICPDVSKTIPIDVNPFPIVDLGKDTSICPNGVPVSISDRVNPGNPDAKFSWNTPTKDATPNALIRTPGVYALTVDIKGCKTTDSVEVKKNCFVNIPNIFTPNGDGQNDYFLPRQLLSSNVSKFDMKIFNRWGEIIFETDATDGRGWDGKVNGEFQPTGVYVYLINVTFGNGTRENYQGNVTMLR